MAKWGKCDFKELKVLQKKLDRLQREDLGRFCEECAKELAARLLAKVIKRTPVGDYSKDVSFTTKKGEAVKFTTKYAPKGGVLRRGWTAKSEREAELTGGGSAAKTHVDSLHITKVGNVYQIEIVNPVYYASYLEYGHRTADHKGWVPGKFMLTISEQELEAQAPKVLEAKLKKYLEGLFDAE